MHLKHSALIQLKEETNSKFESSELKLQNVLKSLSLDFSTPLKGTVNILQTNDILPLSSSDVQIKHPNLIPVKKESINVWSIPDETYMPIKYTSKAVTSSPLADIDLLI